MKKLDAKQYFTMWVGENKDFTIPGIMEAFVEYIMKTKIDNDDFIPYQKCPVCEGTGNVLAPGFTSGCTTVCDICHGAKIIPMHRMKDNYDIPND